MSNHYHLILHVDMVNVDLNPFRAGMAQTPEQSDFTSIQQRIRSFSNNIKSHTQHMLHKQPAALMSFIHHELPEGLTQKCIDFELGNYFDLVDLTGKIILDNKRGAIPEHLAPLLEQLNLTANGWVKIVSGIENSFCYAVGNASLLESFMPGIQKRTATTLRFVNQCYLNLAA